jgi:hypothetical protein
MMQVRYFAVEILQCDDQPESILEDSTIATAGQFDPENRVQLTDLRRKPIVDGKGHVDETHV